MHETIDQRRSTTSRNRNKKATVKPPAYRQREGYDQAIVTLTDAHTKKRRDYCGHFPNRKLGKYWKQTPR